MNKYNIKLVEDLEGIVVQIQFDEKERQLLEEQMNQLEPISQLFNCDEIEPENEVSFSSKELIYTIFIQKNIGELGRTQTIGEELFSDSDFENPFVFDETLKMKSFKQEVLYLIEEKDEDDDEDYFISYFTTRNDYDYFNEIPNWTNLPLSIYLTRIGFGEIEESVFDKEANSEDSIHQLLNKENPYFNFTLVSEF